MKEHFKEQLAAGAPNGGTRFMLHYMLESSDGQVKLLQISNEAVDSLNSTHDFISLLGAVPTLKLKED